MLSVLIPVYLYPADFLVRDLHEQCRLAGIQFEILVGDDSADSYPKTNLDRVADLEQVRIFRHPLPLGRSANRNFLARQSQFPWLLFIDGDAGVAAVDFIEQYIQLQQKGAEVVCGGMLYRMTPPENSEKRLRWHYGLKREMIPSHQRKQNPWRSFSSFNFMIRRDTFLSIGFDEKISGYGHEDTLFGLTLKSKKIWILHADNGIYHEGLEENDLFLKKTSEAVVSLVSLYRSQKIPQDMVREIALLNRGLMISRMHLKRCVLGFLNPLIPWFEKKLQRGSSCILLLDLYKLRQLLSIL